MVLANRVRLPFSYMVYLCDLQRLEGEKAKMNEISLLKLRLGSLILAFILLPMIPLTLILYAPFIWYICIISLSNLFLTIYLNYVAKGDEKE